jgi:hypothetical protein
MIHPNTELRFISEEKGYGVVATQLIPKGTITWVLDVLDQEFTPAEIKKMPLIIRNIIDTYSYRDNKGDFVLCWDHARFVNHSYNSNCMSTAYDVEIAVRDIYPGEELTDDYGYLNVVRPLDFPQEPGSKRKKVMPDDLLHFYPEWDKKLIDAFTHFNRTPQPLLQLLGSECIEKLKQVAAGKIPMESILNCYYNDKRKAIAA